MPQRPTNRQAEARDLLNQDLSGLEAVLQSDIITIFGPIRPGLKNIIRKSVEGIRYRRGRIAIVLDTIGDVIEVVEQMVTAIRHHYIEVDFLIPDRVMSAGTVFVMSGNRIFMNSFSCLGPIDPQIERALNNFRFMNQIPVRINIRMLHLLFLQSVDS
ncbi:MAG: hypothetical protein OXU36_05570 [Candidatus Poribacteria bacterium]|nr:hypothetical protein [Candidatus Poribacteria bacterium]